MTGDEENKDTGGIAATGVEGMSEAEEQLYKLLLDERMKLARTSGTAPYAICGDETLRRMVLTRPSTKARLANIDGVNQHLMHVHGNHFLQRIQQLSKELNITLDKDPDTQPPPISSQAVRVPRKTNLTPAKFEAWRMWQESGLTMQKIANYPGRSAPIKEQTVGEYLLEAAREGYTIDWLRFSEEIGLTQAVYQSIEDAVAKVGKEKLKPIKNELPEEVTYQQIKTCLTVQDLGLSSGNIFLSKHQDSCEKDDNMKEGNETSEETNKSPHNLEYENGQLMDEDNLAESNVQSTGTEEAVELSENPLVARKRQKVNALDVVKATESSIVDWLEKSASGASLSDLVEHFKGSSDESILELLANLEGEFMIFKKNNVYMLM